MDAREVHLLHTALARPAPAVAHLARILSPDEVARAVRFVRDRDRARFIVARATLRHILGEALDIRPADVRFTYGPHGKPELAPGQDPELAFNVAHAGDLALYALARGRRVGVDVEQMADDVDGLAIARRYFAESEVALLETLPGIERQRAFYRLWTAKEAYAKAFGGPLATALQGVTVAPDATGRPVLYGTEREAGLWTLHLVDPEPGYLGAVVAEGRDWDLRCATV
jgi:4'-phosphopantetheinyl transferase